MSQPVQATPPRPPSTQPKLLRPRQYSMRTLLIVMTAVAVAVALFEGLGADFFIGLARGLLVFAMPVCCFTAAIYSRGRWQTFFIGAACMSCLAAVNPGSMRSNSIGELLFFTFNQFAALAVAGAIAMATRFLVERRGWHLDKGTSDTQSPH